MQWILKGASKVMENLALKRPPLQIFAAQTAGQVVLNQYYSSSWKYLLYESFWIVKKNEEGSTSTTRTSYVRVLRTLSRLTL